MCQPTITPGFHGAAGAGRDRYSCRARARVMRPAARLHGVAQADAMKQRIVGVKKRVTKDRLQLAHKILRIKLV
jgi:hypothetical protein